MSVESHAAWVAQQMRPNRLADPAPGYGMWLRGNHGIAYRPERYARGWVVVQNYVNAGSFDRTFDLLRAEYIMMACDKRVYDDGTYDLGDH